MDLEFYPSRLLLMGFLLGATQVWAMEETRMVKRVSGTDLDLSGTDDFVKKDKSLEMYAKKVKPGKPLVVWKVGITGNPAVYFASGNDKKKKEALDKLLAQSENPISRLSCYMLAASDGEFTRDDQATAQLNLRVAQAYVKQIQSNPEQRPEVVSAALALVDRLNSDQALGTAVAPELAQLQNELASIEQPAVADRAAALLGDAIRSAQLNPNDTAMAQYKLALLCLKNGDNEGALSLLSEVLRGGNLSPDIVPNAIQALTVTKYRYALALANRLYGDPSEAERIAREFRQRKLLEDILQPGIQLEPQQLALAQYHLALLCLTGENKDANRAHDLLTAAVNSGNLDKDNVADAQLQLAFLCAGGADGQQQPIARGLFESVIASGHSNAVQLALAQYNLADMCATGRGGARNDEQARGLFEAVVKSSQLPHEEQADAEYNLAMFYVNGRGGVADAIRARELFKSALDSKSLHPISKALAQYNLADIYMSAPADVQNDAQARSLFKEAIESRVLPSHLAEAKYKLATLLKDGRGGVPDLPTMRRLYEEAVADEHGLLPVERILAQYNLALMYAGSQGGDQNSERAVDLFAKTIDSGSLTPEALATAQNTISMLVDPEQKAEVAELAAWENLETAIRSSFTSPQDRAISQYNLAIRYNRGTPGGKTNKRGAAEMFQAAIRSGLLKVNTQAHAEYELAILYAEGRGVDQNGERAIALLNSALASGTLNPEQRADAQRWIRNLRSCTIL